MTSKDKRIDGAVRGILAHIQHLRSEIATAAESKDADKIRSLLSDIRSQVNLVPQGASMEAVGAIHAAIAAAVTQASQADSVASQVVSTVATVLVVGTMSLAVKELFTGFTAQPDKMFGTIDVLKGGHISEAAQQALKENADINLKAANDNELLIPGQKNVKGERLGDALVDTQFASLKEEDQEAIREKVRGTLKAEDEQTEYARELKKLDKSLDLLETWKAFETLRSGAPLADKLSKINSDHKVFIRAHEQLHIVEDINNKPISDHLREGALEVQKEELRRRVQDEVINGVLAPGASPPMIIGGGVNVTEIVSGLLTTLTGAIKAPLTP